MPEKSLSDNRRPSGTAERAQTPQLRFQWLRTSQFNESNHHIDCIHIRIRRVTKYTVHCTKKEMDVAKRSPSGCRRLREAEDYYKKLTGDLKKARARVIADFPSQIPSQIPSLDAGPSPPAERFGFGAPQEREGRGVARHCLLWRCWELARWRDREVGRGGGAGREVVAGRGGGEE